MTPRRRLALLPVLVALLTAFLAAPASAAGGDRLALGETLSGGQGIVSPSGQYAAVLQDGNLVIYRAGFGIRWRASRLPADNAVVTLRQDGNLMVVGSDGSTRWQSGTAGLGVTSLVIGNDGNLVLQTSSGSAAWTSQTAIDPSEVAVAIPSGGLMSSPSGQFILRMQPEGNLVLYGIGGVFWATPTGVPGSRAVLTGSGELQIVTPAEQVVWRSYGAGAYPMLTVQDDGNVVIYTDRGPVWATGTPLPNCNWVTSSQPISATTTTSNGVRVHTCLVDAVERMIRDAGREGINLWGYGWRSTDRQVELRIQNCGGDDYYTVWQMPSSQCDPPTAIPGRSMHEKGLAIDFNRGGRAIVASDPEFQWLVANAYKYGLKNLPSETWHWSTNGG
jgi:hypothetical protein